MAILDPVAVVLTRNRRQPRRRHTAPPRRDPGCWRHDVTLAPDDLFARVVALRPLFDRRYAPLAVEERRAGIRLVADALTIGHDQRVIDSVPHALPQPTAE